MRKHLVGLAVAWAVWGGQVDPARAGTLERFERGVTGSPGSRSTTTRYSGGCSLGDILAQAIVEGIVEGFFYGMAYGGVNSLALMYAGPEVAPHIGVRRPGDAVIPFAALEANYQDIEGDVLAWDYRAEAGFAFLGMAWRKTAYREDDSDLDLDVSQVHGIYRMTFGDELEVGIGFGSLEIKGEERRDGFSFTTPIRLHVGEGLGVEYRPVWSTIDEQRLYDNDLALVIGARYAFLRVGYRWFYHSSESLSGFQFGGCIKW